jgi:hypothetical protein
MEVATLQQPTSTEHITNTMENSMDIDMDIDLDPLPEADAIETVSLFDLFAADLISLTDEITRTMSKNKPSQRRMAS